MIRGVVVSPATISKKDGGIHHDHSLSTVEINYLCLYWDKISIPTNNIIHFGVSNEEILIDAGVLVRPEYVLKNFSTDQNDFNEFYIECQFDTLNKLRQRDLDTDWRANQIGNEIILPNDYGDQSEDVKFIRLELDQLLPVPGGDVHIHDILEFKQRRAAELTALHSYCDDLYLEVLSSADPNLTRARNYSRLRGAIEDLHKINKEGWQSPIRFSIDISSEFDLSHVRAGYVALCQALQSPQPLETVAIGSLISLLEGFVKIKPEVRSIRKRRDINENLIYLTNARKEGLITG
ncbi:TPA: hypothetical protein MD887_002600 [Klebsiella oxytoca]|nr:hypothetical protein [Klebsiella oxytoca]